MTPNIDATPAGGSPPRPVPKIGEQVEVVRLPEARHQNLMIGGRGTVLEVKGAMFWVRFGWGVAKLSSVQIELLGKRRGGK